MLRRPQPFCPSLSISQTIWQPSVCAMFALRAQDFSSFTVVVTSILEPGSQFGAVGGPDHGYASSLPLVILHLSEISQPRTPVQAILLCALCPEHSQLPK